MLPTPRAHFIYLHDIIRTSERQVSMFVHYDFFSTSTRRSDGPLAPHAFLYTAVPLSPTCHNNSTSAVRHLRARADRKVYECFPSRFSAADDGRIGASKCHTNGTPIGPQKVWAGRGIEAHVYEIVRRVTYLFFVLRDRLVLRHDPDSDRESGETAASYRGTSFRERRSSEPDRDVSLGRRSDHSTTTSFRLAIQ